MSKVEQFAVNIVNKTFTVIQTKDLKEGDVVIWLQATNVGYEKPTKVLSVERINKSDFFDVLLDINEPKVDPLWRVAFSGLWGRLEDDTNPSLPS